MSSYTIYENHTLATKTFWNCKRYPYTITTKQKNSTGEKNKHFYKGDWHNEFICNTNAWHSLTEGGRGKKEIT